MLTIVMILSGLALLAGIAAVIMLARRKAETAMILDALDKKSGDRDKQERAFRDDLQRLRSDLLGTESDTRKELNAALALQNDALGNQNRNLREEISAALAKLNQQANADAGKNRAELTQSLNNLSESLSRKLQDLTQTQQTQFEALKTSLEARLEQIRTNNEAKLEQMRKTVDEKLHDTLEKRLGESFKQVSERLELVHKGLGEMQSLASGVGDLKKVLSNVKNRGIMGEYQLENILEDLFTPDQYERNFRPHKRRDEVVEFALKLPGKDDVNQSVYLPLDAKFPIADYQRLTEAFEANDLAGIETERKNLVARIKASAKDIRDKYLNPPVTTDFAVLFLPFEGLYAEVLRNPGLFEQVMRDYHVLIGGPTTISALLNSLLVGFRTLAIQKKTSEVWKVLAGVKKDFMTFGEILERTRHKVDDVSKELDNASHRTRQIQRKLTRVQELPQPEETQILDLAPQLPLLDEPEDDQDST